MLCGAFFRCLCVCVCACACAQWGARLYFHHKSPPCMCTFRFFSIFSPMLAPKPRGAHIDINVHRGDVEMGVDGGTTCNFWLIYCGLRITEGPLFWFCACKCCMYVRSQVQLATPCACMLVVGGPNPILATPCDIPHFLKLPFMSGAQEARLSLQALGPRIPKARGGGSRDYFFGCLPHPNSSKVCQLCVVSGSCRSRYAGHSTAW